MKTRRKRPPVRGRRRRTRRVILDGTTITAFLGAAVILQLLVFTGGWITGQHAIEPLRLFAAKLTAPRVAPPPPAVQVAAAVPVAAATRAVELTAVKLTFAPLPPVERPRQEPPPRLTLKRPEFYRELIREAAQEHDLPVALVEAVVRVESDFNARALSPKGARGLMQVMPATARRFGVDDPEHLFYPAPNIAAGTAYLAWLMKRFDGNLDLALAAYNAGEGAVDQYNGIPPYRETREYVRRVRKALGRIAA